MKPRTKLQVEVMQYSDDLLKLQSCQRDWAYRECLEHKGFATKTRVICMDCGNTFSPVLVKRKHAVCPHCNTNLTVEKTKKYTDKQKVYFGTAEIYGEYQVVRFYILEAQYRMGYEAHRNSREILQHWILPNGKREVVARGRSFNWYSEGWQGCLEIRNKREIHKYDVYPYAYYPGSVFKPEYRKYGINHHLKGLTFLEAITVVPYNPHAETLLKAGQYSLLSLCNNGYGYFISDSWPTIKICMRNRYTVEDGGMYKDYIQLLKYFGKDLHNAHYVCPKNLKREHDRLVDKKRKIQEREAMERKRREAKNNEAKYKEFIKRFLDLVFVDDDIEVRPLQSVDEFVKEGDAMRHCVFTNEYFKMKHSLILSARRNGDRLETVEFSLEKMKVVQSRGKFNANTEYHHKIVRLVNRNREKIRELVNG